MRKFCKFFVICLVLASSIFVFSSCNEKFYNIQLTQTEHGLIACDLSEAKAGEEITIQTIAEPGYQLGALLCNGKILQNNTFLMPKCDVNVQAMFCQMPNEDKIDVRLGTYNCTTSTYFDGTKDEATTDKDFFSVTFKEGQVFDAVVAYDHKIQFLSNISYSVDENKIHAYVFGKDRELFLLDQDTIVYNDQTTTCLFSYNEQVQLPKGHLESEVYEEKSLIVDIFDDKMDVNLNNGGQIIKTSVVYFVRGNWMYVTSQNNVYAIMLEIKEYSSETDLIFIHNYYYDEDGMCKYHDLSYFRFRMPKSDISL